VRRHLRGDHGGPVGPPIGREPELAQRGRRAGKGDERLTGDLGEGDLPPPGVPGAEHGIAGPGGQRPHAHP
jgi:hypothetical protein